MVPQARSDLSSNWSIHLLLGEDLPIGTSTHSSAVVLAVKEQEEFLSGDGLEAVCHALSAGIELGPVDDHLLEPTLGGGDFFSSFSETKN